MKNKRYYSLDLLKFICAILIMIGHFQGETHFVFIKDFRNGAHFSSGDLVILFFIISGFFAANRINKIRDNNYLYYIGSKLKRLLPMTVLATFFCLLVDWLYLVLYRHYIYGTQLGIWRVFSSFIFTYSGGSFLLDNNGINGQLWYVCVLLICYSFLYFILWLKDYLKINLNTIVFVSIFILLGIYEYNINLPFLNHNTSLFITVFFLGIIINKLNLFLIDKPKLFKKAFFISLATLFSCVLLGIVRYDIFFDYPEYIYSFIIFPSVMMIFIYLDTILDMRAFRYLGPISFEIYIWHTSFINLLMCLEKIAPSLFSNGYSLIYELIYMIFVVSFSCAVYFFVEVPISKRTNNKN